MDKIEKIDKDTYNKLYSLMECGRVPTKVELDLFIKDYRQPSTDREAVEKILIDGHALLIPNYDPTAITDQILSLQPKVLSDEKLTEIAEMIYNFNMDIDGIKGVLEQVAQATKEE